MKLFRDACKLGAVSLGLSGPSQSLTRLVSSLDLHAQVHEHATHSKLPTASFSSAPPPSLNVPPAALLLDSQSHLMPHGRISFRQQQQVTEVLLQQQQAAMAAAATAAAAVAAPPPPGMNFLGMAAAPPVGVFGGGYPGLMNGEGVL